MTLYRDDREALISRVAALIQDVGLERFENALSEARSRVAAGSQTITSEALKTVFDVQSALDAAKDIFDIRERDSVYEKIVQKCLTFGWPENALKAALIIFNIGLRDKNLEAIVDSYLAERHFVAAKKVAIKIFDSNARDEMLRKITEVSLG